MPESENKTLPAPPDTILVNGDEWLRISLHGNDEEMIGLHERCDDRTFAVAFAQVLRNAPVSYRERTSAWLAVIQELHPDLIVGPGAKVSRASQLTPATAPMEPAGHGPSFSALCRSIPVLFARFVSPHRNR